MADTFAIAIAEDLADPAERSRPNPYLRAALAEATELTATIAAKAGAAVEGLILGGGKADAQLLQILPNLRILARHGAGFDNVDLDAMTRAGVVVTNAPNAVQRPVALMALTFILGLGQSLRVKDVLVRQGRWSERQNHVGLGITGRRVGIIGSGGVGLETARLAKAVGMHATVARSPRNAHLASQGFVLASLDEVFTQSDFVVLACRLSPETHHLVTAERLRLMRPTAFVINVARGSVVDEPALIEALWSGTIAGAGLDVFEQEPVDPANPLLRMDNVMLAPHALCATEETFGAIATEALACIRAFAAHQVPPNVVNPGVLEHERMRAWLATGRNEPHHEREN
jgi:D-3-phosphoglycerate dehydrogenase